MTTSDDAYMTPQGLLQRIHDEREALAATWGALTMEQLVQRPGPQDDWSVKDLIAHVTRWESFILQRVTDLMDGVPSKPAEPHDVLNARAYRQNRDRPLAEVLAAFDANWPRLVMLLTSLNEEQLIQIQKYGNKLNTKRSQKWALCRGGVPLCAHKNVKRAGTVTCPTYSV